MGEVIDMTTGEIIEDQDVDLTPRIIPPHLIDAALRSLENKYKH